ncbi:MAG TPA: hypothetical protein VFF07_01930 [Actinomycetota bacterium]|nr:hypothetical protein [Actinomycetota bacterium]
MLADRALRAAFSNFSTLFLLAATIALPLHLTHGYLFQEVYEVRDLHPVIEAFPKGRRIARVSPRRLQRSRNVATVVLVAELALLPLLAGAALRVVRTHEEGGVPTALGSWRGVRDIPRLLAARSKPGVVVVGAAVALAVGWLAQTTGLILAEPVPDSWAWLAISGVEGLARAAAAPFLVAALAVAALQGAGTQKRAERA